ncbi:hypothetical protein ACIQZO_32785 [Streptomyces sp. NPDC097617]|uniref:hypothetical protein n=1 Tax=Streptomyces sp. NPDC097617 TaxID=3366091 RepID=UPI00381969B2
MPIPPAERLRALPKKELLRICQKPTITVRPGDLGKLDKFRQDRHYLHPTWQDAYRPERANIEGVNGRLKSHGINIADPSKRLAHGRTILLALVICSANLQMLLSWTQTTGTTGISGIADAITEFAGTAPASITANGIPPPGRWLRTARVPDIPAPHTGLTHAQQQPRHPPRTRTTPKSRLIPRQATARGPARVRTSPRTHPTNAEIPPSLSAERDLVTFLESYSRTAVCGPVGI